jgi:hypothetical protein
LDIEHAGERFHDCRVEVRAGTGVQFGDGRFHDLYVDPCIGRLG